MKNSQNQDFLLSIIKHYMYSKIRTQKHREQNYVNTITKRCGEGILHDSCNFTVLPHSLNYQSIILNIV